MIEIRNLKKTYDNVTPIEDISVTIRDGDVIAVIGPSGTGKSTFIRCINLLEQPTSGQIFLNGEEITAKGYDIRQARQKIGMVFQSFHLFEHLTVIENVMIAPMDLLKKSKQEAYNTGMALLRRVGVADKALNYPDELSGGQKQRVAIARTLCMNPEVILLDEPTSALDPTMVAEVQAVIRELSQSGKTMIIVTHEMNFARAISNRVFYMDEGGIYEEGTPDEIFEHPKKERTQQFIRRMRIFETVIQEKDYDFIHFGAMLDQYLLQNDVPPIMKYRIRLAIEELVQQMLMPHLQKPSIRVKVAYSMQESSCLVTVSYAGDAFDVTKTSNELSMTMLQSTVESIRYFFDEEKTESNCVEMQLRQD